MATKIYKLNQKKNTASFPLSANDGKLVITYEFRDGNQFVPNTPARCTLRNEFYQNLLEESNLFKRGIISLERTIDDDDAKKAPAEKKTRESVEQVTSPEEAISYVFDHWGVTVRSGKQAVKIAAQKGVDFPNLKERQ